MLKGILVGLGARGGHWVNVCKSSEHVELVAYVDSVEEKRKEAVEKFSLSEQVLFSDVEEALGSVEADFVLDVTPPSAREAIAQKALENGKHVLAEKAMGEDWEMARRIAKMAEESGLVYMVTQNYRFRPLPRTTNRLLSEGFLGTINTVTMGFYRPWGLGRHYVEIPYALLLEMTVHHFDTLRYVLGCEPVWVWAHTWNAPWGWHRGM